MNSLSSLARRVWRIIHPKLLFPLPILPLVNFIMRLPFPLQAGVEQIFCREPSRFSNIVQVVSTTGVMRPTDHRNM